MSLFSRRGFFLTGLAGLVAGFLGRSQARAASPPLAAVPKTPAPAGDAISITVSDGGCSEAVSFSWEVTSLPPGLSINPNTGLIHGTISLDKIEPTLPGPEQPKK